MLRDETTADRESQSGPLARFLRREERRHELLVYFGAYSGPTVGDGENDEARFLDHVERDPTILFRQHGVERVVEQVEQNLDHLRATALQSQTVWNLSHF